MPKICLTSVEVAVAASISSKTQASSAPKEGQMWRSHKTLTACSRCSMGQQATSTAGSSR